MTNRFGSTARVWTPMVPVETCASAAATLLGCGPVGSGSRE